LELIVVYTVLTLLCVFFISADSSVSFVRVAFAFIFAAFFPGYCLINFLFRDDKFDFIEVIVLSVALSFSIDGISGLFLGLSSIGLNVTSIVETVSGIVLVLALLAFLRKMGVLRVPSRKLHVQTPTQVGS
jgi:uncharacterized membrane protein